jgi:hypothetical protein
MSVVCSRCAKDPVLKRLIGRRSTNEARCDVCRSKKVPVLDVKDRALRNMVRALVRYHYSEWDYNSHWGGDGLESLLMEENLITTYSPEAAYNEEAYLDFTAEVFDTGYEDYDKGVSLFAGYDNCGQLPLLRSLKTERTFRLQKIERALETTNHFLLEQEIDALLAPYVPTLSALVPAGTVMHRARIGVKMKAMPMAGWGNEWHYKPYSAKDLGAPPPASGGNGRLNRPGVSFLYLATDEHTAICEVRPHPGHSISVGAFQSSRKLKVADFTKVSILNFYRSDKLLDDYLLLKNIDDSLGLPVAPDDKGKYSLTQLISDSFRRLGFEGVAYQSSVSTSGTNLAVFDASTFDYVDGSAKCVEVMQLQYTFGPMPAMGSKREYLYDGNGNML